MGNRDNFPKKQVVTHIKDPRLVEKKHRQIVEAAGRLFSKKGYHATTLREISAESGINLSYLYKYISSKDDILYLFYKHLHNQWAHVYEELGNSREGHPVEQLKDLTRSILEIGLRFNDQMLTMYTESRHMEKTSLQTVLSEESRMIAQLEKLIERGVSLGYFKTKDSFMAANIIQYVLAIYPLRGWNFRGQYSFTRFVKLVTDFVLSALGVSEGDR